MPSTHDQHPVQQLTTHSAYPPLGVGVRPWCPHGCAEDPDALGGEDGIEGVGELRVPIANQELEMLDVVGQLHEQVAGLLVVHIPVGLAVTPRMWTRPVASSPTNSTYRRWSSTVSAWQQVAGQDPLGVRSEERRVGKEC